MSRSVYIEAGKQVSIIAVSLSVSDTGEADKLAFNIEVGQVEVWLLELPILAQREKKA